MKRFVSQSIPVVLVIVFICGCATMETRWKEVESANTIEAYGEFLKQYSEGEFADKARDRVWARLAPDIKKVKILFTVGEKLSHEEIKWLTSNLPEGFRKMEDAMKVSLNSSGLHFVTEKSFPRRVLSIKSTGPEYVPEIGHTCKWEFNMGSMPVAFSKDSLDYLRRIFLEDLFQEVNIVLCDSSAGMPDGFFVVNLSLFRECYYYIDGRWDRGGDSLGFSLEFIPVRCPAAERLVRLYSWKYKLSSPQAPMLSPGYIQKDDIALIGDKIRTMVWLVRYGDREETRRKLRESGHPCIPWWLEKGK